MNGRMISFHSFLLLLSCVVATSCKGNQQTASSGMFSSPARAASENLANDYTKPYLTDEKMTHLIASMKEEHNPFEVIFKDKGSTNLMDLANRLEEFNSFARKYGFQDYQDYTAVWGRVMAGEVQLWGAEMTKDNVKTFQKAIDDAQADLRKPNLSPEQRKLDEDQIVNMQKTIDDMNKSSSNSGLTAADLMLVKKYWDQIDEAQKKYKTGQLGVPRPI
jgi:hypothetical protein